MKRNRVTKRDKGEFARRCKALARRLGQRVQYHPARFDLVLFDELRIFWRPDEQCLYVRMRMRDRKPGNEFTSMVLEEVMIHRRWGFTDKIHHHLELMRQMMVLDELAGA